MSDDNQQEKQGVEVLIALAVLSEKLESVLKRLDGQDRMAATQATTMAAEFKHAIRNAEARIEADITSREKLADQRLKAIEDGLSTKADLGSHNLVKSIVFGLVCLVLVAFATSLTRSVITHEAKPAAVVSYQLN